MTGLRWAHQAARCVAAPLLASCAGPPLTLYTLDTLGPASDAAPLGRRALVIEVSRVSLPNAFDTEDILVRHGSVLQRSAQGRWASRLSAGITGLLAARRGACLPSAGQYQPAGRDGRGHGSGGGGLAGDTGKPGSIAASIPWGVQRHGAVATDQDVVTLERAVLDQLASRIDDVSLK